MNSNAACLSHSTIDSDPSYINKTDLEKLTEDNTGTILSLYWKNGTLGAASYNRNLSELQILHDVLESNLDFKILNSLFIQVRPENVVVSQVQNGTFLKLVKQLAYKGKININTSPTNNDYYKSDKKVHILPNKYFKFKTCEEIILCMSLALAPKNEESRKHYIRSLVDFTQELAVRALGALLYFLQERSLDSPLIKLNLPNTLNILSLKVINMDDVVLLGMSTFESLQIFSAHDLSIQSSTCKQTKDLQVEEGPSIYNLLNRCSSFLGSMYLKNILAQPTNNINILECRHELIEFCLQPCNKNIILLLVNCIKHCHCVLLLMVKMNGGKVSMAQWKSLYQTLTNVVTIGEICERYAEKIKFFKKIKDALKYSLHTMLYYMSCIIDFDQSIKNGRFVVKAGFIPELDEKKSRVKNISQLLENVAFLELKTLPSYIKECSVCKMTEVGYLLCIPFWKSIDEMTEHDYEIQNLEFKFKLTNHAYYKTSKCYELDQIFGEIEFSIIQEETKIMIKLTEAITQNWIGDLHEIIKLVAELDCLISLANVAQDFNLIKPKVLPREMGVINIVNGRHILQEKYVDMFVPNSYHSSKKNQKIKIITGLNSSGKSIYLKQVALISYLCHIGCYVPAEFTEISVLDHIHAGIQSTESASTLMSAFMVDIQQMSVALNESTCASLIILDEFGRGTSETNAKALLLACIKHFVYRPTELLPHIIVSTHFHALSYFLRQIVDPDTLHHNIKCLNMSHIIENNKIVCLYKIVDKTEDQDVSMAHHIAALNGLPTSIIERATQVLRLIQNGECINPVHENLRYQLFNRRLHFFVKLLDLVQGEVTESTYADLVDDLESVRYP